MQQTATVRYHTFEHKRKQWLTQHVGSLATEPAAAVALPAAGAAARAGPRRERQDQATKPVEQAMSSEKQKQQEQTTKPRLHDEQATTTASPSSC